MKESQLLNIITNTIDSSCIGDDCAYLKDLGIVVSQDTLVEDVHFRLSWMTPEELGIKAVLVNISDILASGAIPAYITISLSLPKDMDDKFVQEFYLGINSVCKQYGVKVAGGDLTGSEKVCISICAIGRTEGRNIASRGNAKEGYKIVVAGNHGSSAAGLNALEKGCLGSQFINVHKAPVLQVAFSELLSTQCKEEYAMMDTSDGLADALFKIAQASGVTLEVDLDTVPFERELMKLGNYQDLILFGGEDYSLVGVVPNEMPVDGYSVIGTVVLRQSAPLVIRYKNEIKEYQSIEEFTYKHF